MSAAELREAAALIRERAEAATYTYVKDHPDPAKAGQPVPWFDAADAYCFDDTDGPHIMAWSPAVALAVADLVEVIAEAVEAAALGLLLPATRAALRIAEPEAAALARVYLGSAQ